MKRFTAAVAALVFSAGVMAAPNNTLQVNQEACSIVYNISEAAAKLVMEKGLVESFNYDELFQRNFWHFYNESKKSEGIRFTQAVNAMVASTFLRENNIDFSVQVRRIHGKFGKDGYMNETSAMKVADYMYNSCRRTTTFEFSPMTLPNPGVQL